MNLSPRQLRIFVLLSENLSFQKSAEILHITQPTLSKLLKEMEESLGIQLFERSTRVVKLSRDGLDILDIAKNMASMYEQGMVSIHARLRETDNRIAIAALPTLAASLLPKLIQQLNLQAPDARIQVYDPVANEALDLLRNRKVDISITAFGAEVPTDLIYQELFKEEFVLFHSSEFEIATKEWDVAEMSKLPLISMPIGTSVRSLTENAFSLARHQFSPIYSLRDLNTIARFVQSNCGIALMPESSLDHASHHGISMTRLRGSLARSIGLFTRKDFVPNKLACIIFQELFKMQGKDCQRGAA